MFCIKKDDQKYTSKAGYHTKQSVPYFSKCHYVHFHDHNKLKGAVLSGIWIEVADCN